MLAPAVSLVTFYTLSENSGRLLDLFHIMRGSREIEGHCCWLLPYLDPFSTVSNNTKGITMSNRCFSQRTWLFPGCICGERTKPTFVHNGLSGFGAEPGAETHDSLTYWSSPCSPSRKYRAFLHSSLCWVGTCLKHTGLTFHSFASDM